MTIRFLLKYMTRPLHFFGLFGALGIFGGSAISVFLLALKVFTHQHVMDQHGPLFVIAAVMILAGTQLLALGLLGELQVRHFTRRRSARPTPSIDWCGCGLRKSPACCRTIKIRALRSACARCGNQIFPLFIHISGNSNL